ncbi:MAG: hypothetical protein HQK55_10745 [Deltaproteobacteria bacterium]|nr:hypothetical protein [Deltaproteobacteria bacterium]
MMLNIESGVGYDLYECPSCGATGHTTFIDGDCIMMGVESIPRDVLPDLSFYASLYFFRCEACGREFYVVNIDAVDNPTVSEGWIVKYFWRVEPSSEPETHVTMTYDGAGADIPGKWLATYIDTPEGRLTRYFLGPFISESRLVGPNGVARCPAQSEWDKATRLVIDFLQFQSVMANKPKADELGLPA